MTIHARVTLAAIGGAALLPVLLPHPFVLTIATQAVIWALLAASWDLLSGYTGQISFGHAGFFALGAYAAAASTKHADVSPWLGLLVGATIAAAVGLLTGFPALRLRGHYLALVTLGLAEIIRLVAQNWLALTGGPFGMHDFRSFPGLPDGALAHRQAMYLVVVAVVAGSVAVMYQVCVVVVLLITPAGYQPVVWLVATGYAWFGAVRCAQGRSFQYPLLSNVVGSRR